MGTVSPLFEKAGTIILGASILVWFLTAYPLDVEYSQDFDAARDQVTETMEATQASILQSYGLASMEDNAALQSMYDEMVSVADAEAEAADAEEQDVENVADAEALEENRHIQKALQSSRLKTRPYMPRHYLSLMQK